MGPTKGSRGFTSCTRGRRWQGRTGASRAVELSALARGTSSLCPFQGGPHPWAHRRSRQLAVVAGACQPPRQVRGRTQAHGALSRRSRVCAFRVESLSPLILAALILSLSPPHRTLRLWTMTQLTVGGYKLGSVEIALLVSAVAATWDTLLRLRTISSKAARGELHCTLLHAAVTILPVPTMVRLGSRPRAQPGAPLRTHGCERHRRRRSGRRLSVCAVWPSGFAGWAAGGLAIAQPWGCRRAECLPVPPRGWVHIRIPGAPAQPLQQPGLCLRFHVRPRERHLLIPCSRGRNADGPAHPRPPYGREGGSGGGHVGIAHAALPGDPEQRCGCAFPAHARPCACPTPLLAPPETSSLHSLAPQSHAAAFSRSAATRFGAPVLPEEATLGLNLVLSAFLYLSLARGVARETCALLGIRVFHIVHKKE